MTTAQLKRAAWLRRAAARYAAQRAAFPLIIKEQAQQRRLPANGRKLLALRQQGLSPVLAVLILDGWAPTAGIEEHEPWIAVIPDDTPVALVDFRCVAGLTVYIVADRLPRLDEIALQVMRFGPKAAFGWADQSKDFVVYAKDRS